MKTIKLMLISCAIMFSSFVYAASNPVPMLENAANNVLITLEKNKTNLKNNPQIVRNAVNDHLVPIVDVVGMSRSVVGRQAWKNATALEKKEFSKAFQELVIRTYANPLAEYKGERIKFLPIRGNADGQFVKVNSIIKRSNGQNIPLSYSLVSKNNHWKIYDFSVEGVSLLQSFRQQFSTALKNSNMQEVIKHMKQKKA